MALKTRYSPLQHLSLDNVYNSFVELSPQNKMIAMAVAGGLVILLLILPLSLASGKISSLKREIATAQTGYRDVVRKIEEYERGKGDVEALEKSLGGAGGSLTGRIEEIARENGLTITQLNERPPQETDFLEINLAEMRASGVALSQLVDFLTALEAETRPVLRVRRIQVKPQFKNRQLLDVTCEIATFVIRKEV